MARAGGSAQLTAPLDPAAEHMDALKNRSLALEAAPPQPLEEGDVPSASPVQAPAAPRAAQAASPSQQPLPGVCSPQRASISELRMSLASKLAAPCAQPQQPQQQHPSSVLRMLPLLAAGSREARAPSSAGQEAPEAVAADPQRGSSGAPAQHPASTAAHARGGGKEPKRQPGFGRLPGMGGRGGAAAQQAATAPAHAEEPKLAALPRLPPRPWKLPDARARPAPARWLNSPLRRLLARARAPCSEGPEPPVAPDLARAGAAGPLEKQRRDQDSEGAPGPAAPAGADGSAARPMRQRQPARKIILNAEADYAAEARKARRREEEAAAAAAARQAGQKSGVQPPLLLSAGRGAGRIAPRVPLRAALGAPGFPAAPKQLQQQRADAALRPGQGPFTMVMGIPRHYQQPPLGQSWAAFASPTPSSQRQPAQLQGGRAGAAAAAARLARPGPWQAARTPQLPARPAGRATAAPAARPRSRQAPGELSARERAALMRQWHPAAMGAPPPACPACGARMALLCAHIRLPICRACCLRPRRAAGAPLQRSDEKAPDFSHLRLPLHRPIIPATGPARAPPPPQPSWQRAVQRRRAPPPPRPARPPPLPAPKRPAAKSAQELHWPAPQRGAAPAKQGGKAARLHAAAAAAAKVVGDLQPKPKRRSRAHEPADIDDPPRRPRGVRRDRSQPLPAPVPALPAPLAPKATPCSGSIAATPKQSFCDPHALPGSGGAQQPSGATTIQAWKSEAAPATVTPAVAECALVQPSPATEQLPSARAAQAEPDPQGRRGAVLGHAEAPGAAPDQAQPARGRKRPAAAVESAGGAPCDSESEGAAHDSASGRTKRARRAVNYNEQQLQSRRWKAAQQPPKQARGPPGTPVLAPAAHACGDRTELLMRAMPPGERSDAEGAAGFSMSRFCARVAAIAHEQRPSGSVPSPAPASKACQRPWTLALQLGDCERALHACLRAPRSSILADEAPPGGSGAAKAPAAPAADPSRQHAELLDALAQHLNSACEEREEAPPRPRGPVSGRAQGGKRKHQSLAALYGASSEAQGSGPQRRRSLQGS